MSWLARVIRVAVCSRGSAAGIIAGHVVIFSVDLARQGERG